MRTAFEARDYAGCLLETISPGRVPAACSKPSSITRSATATNCCRCSKGCRMKTIFFDVDTQIDFLYPAGALYVPGAESIVDRRSPRLNRMAPALISTMDAHSENDPEFQLYPAHCVAGTVGQRKPACTLVGQAIVEKQTLDCFSRAVPASPFARIGCGSVCGVWRGHRDLCEVCGFWITQDGRARRDRDGRGKGTRPGGCTRNAVGVSSRRRNPVGQRRFRLK